jgi:dihydroxyacetone kinase-like predicted kinase
VILPNNKNIVPVAEQVQGQTAKRVRVVPTRGVAEGFAALMAYDPEAPGDENEAEMREAAEHVAAGEVTRAVRSSSCELGPIAEGDWLGISREGIRSIEKELWDAATGLLADLLTADHEIVTLIEGEGASAGATRRITEWVAEHHPDVSCEIHHGGQPLYPYYVGIE